MLLVVVGHVLTQFTEMDSARGVYVWIYSFHMPFFVLISGYTARNYVGDARQVKRIVSTLVVPYLITELALQLITRHYTGEPDPLMILSPQWLAWFLAAFSSGGSHADLACPPLPHHDVDRHLAGRRPD